MSDTASFFEISKAFVEDLKTQDLGTTHIRRKILQIIMLVTSVISLAYAAYFIYHLGPHLDLIHSVLLFIAIGANFWFRNTSVKPLVLDSISIFSTYVAFFWVQALLGPDSGINLTALCSFIISLMMFFPNHPRLLGASWLCSISLFISPAISDVDLFYLHYRDQISSLPLVRTQMEIAVYVAVILTCYLFAVFWASRVVALKKEKHEKENYLKVLTHDLKHPIVHSLVAIRKLKESGSYVAGDINALEIAQFTVKEIINNIENLESDKINLSKNLSEFHLLDCLDQLLPWLDSRLREKNITIDSTEVNSAHRITGHFESMTFQVLQNILTNAIKFSNPNSVIRFKTQQTETSICWQISDQGSGIDDQDLANGLKPSAGTFGERGTGFGIKIVRLFAEKSRVQVSWAKNGGTTVSIIQTHEALTKT